LRLSGKEFEELNQKLSEIGWNCERDLGMSCIRLHRISKGQGNLTSVIKRLNYDRDSRLEIALTCLISQEFPARLQKVRALIKQKLVTASPLEFEKFLNKMRIAVGNIIIDSENETITVKQCTFCEIGKYNAIGWFLRILMPRGAIEQVFNFFITELVNRQASAFKIPFELLKEWIQFIADYERKPDYEKKVVWKKIPLADAFINKCVKVDIGKRLLFCHYYSDQNGASPLARDKNIYTSALIGKERETLIKRLLSERNHAGILAISNRLGLDIRTVEYGLLHPLFVGFDMAGKGIINAFDEDIVAVNGGAGASIARFLLFTNAPRAYFIETSDILLDKLENALQHWDGLLEDRLIKGYLARQWRSGFGDSYKKKMYDIEDKIIAELKCLGVNKFNESGVENIIIYKEDDDSTRIEFDWAYHGKDRRSYSITYIKTDITDVRAYPKILDDILNRGIGIYYQKAGFDIGGRYVRFLYKIASSIKEGGYLATEDKANAIKIDNPDSLLQRWDLNYTKSGELWTREMKLFAALIKEFVWHGTVKSAKINVDALDSNELIKECRYGAVVDLRQRSVVISPSVFRCGASPLEHKNNSDHVFAMGRGQDAVSFMHEIKHVVTVAPFILPDTLKKRYPEKQQLIEENMATFTGCVGALREVEKVINQQIKPYIDQIKQGLGVDKCFDAALMELKKNLEETEKFVFPLAAIIPKEEAGKELTFGKSMQFVIKHIVEANMALRNFLVFKGHTRRLGNVRDVLVSLTEDFKYILEAEGLKFDIRIKDVEALDREAFTYFEMLKAGYLQILHNAFDYRDDSKGVLDIEMEAYLAGGDVVIKISDNGKGVAEGELRRIFLPRGTLENKQKKGWGVGLATLKHNIEEVGGFIEASHNSKGGLSVSFGLPIQLLPDAAMPEAIIGAPEAIVVYGPWGSGARVLSVLLAARLGYYYVNADFLTQLLFCKIMDEQRPFLENAAEAARYVESFLKGNRIQFQKDGRVIIEDEKDITNLFEEESEDYSYSSLFRGAVHKKVRDNFAQFLKFFFSEGVRKGLGSYLQRLQERVVKEYGW